MEPEQVRNIMDSMIRKLYDMELEELGRSGWQDEKLLSEVRKLPENNKASIQVEDKTGREGVDLAFAIAELGRNWFYARIQVCISAFYGMQKGIGSNDTRC